jgi:hypothetical protein
LIQETGGLCKVRWTIKGEGKSGGLRVIYFFVTAAAQTARPYSRKQCAGRVPAASNRGDYLRAQARLSRGLGLQRQVNGNLRL